MKREIMLFNPFGRETPPSAIGDWLQDIEESGLVDYYGVYDNLVAWWPLLMWREFMPNADLVPDIDSYYDPAFLLGLASAKTERLGITMNATNAVRNGPAEVMRLALSIAGARPEKSFLAIGAGEAYTMSPFGYDRSKGLRRLEDSLKLFKLMLECDGPFDYTGKEINFSQAYIGTIRPHRPRIWTVGAGPRLSDLTTTYADGNTGAAPVVYPTPERFAGFVTSIKQDLERKGRDPDSFEFALEFPILLDDDVAMIEEVLTHPLIKLFAAVYGRFGTATWEQEGLQSVMPAGWKYALHWQPNSHSRKELFEIIDRVSPEMVRRTFEGFVGTVEHVGASVDDYYDAGMTLACFFDMMPAFRRFDPAVDPMEQTMRLCRRLKDRESAPTP